MRTGTEYALHGAPAIGATIRPRDLCWANSPKGDIYGECKAATVREGLCVEHYREIFGREP